MIARSYTTIEIHTSSEETKAATKVDLRSQRTFRGLCVYSISHKVMNLPPLAPAIGAQITGDLMPGNNEGRID